MIMSERDSVHKEIEKLQDDVSNTNSKMKEVKFHFGTISYYLLKP